MIHPSAVVAPSARVHEGAFIGPWCVLEPGVEVAEGARLEARIHVFQGTKIGEGTAVYDGCVLGAPPQDLKYGGEPTELLIGKRCLIREYCTINRGTKASGKTVIEDDALLMAYVHVAHDCVIGKGAVVSNSCQLGGHVQVGEYATIGGTAGVQQRQKIGAYSFVGASLKVDKDVPPAVRALGNPLRFAGLNLHALRRFPDRFPAERVAALDLAYRALYRSGRPAAEVIDELKNGGEPLLAAFFKDWSGNLIR